MVCFIPHILLHLHLQPATRYYKSCSELLCIVSFAFKLSLSFIHHNLQSSGHCFLERKQSPLKSLANKIKSVDKQWQQMIQQLQHPYKRVLLSRLVNNLLFLCREGYQVCLLFSTGQFRRQSRDQRVSKGRSSS